MVCLILLLFSSLTVQVVIAGPSFNPYSVLGVTKDATQDDIKRKYRKLCLQYHPDKNVQKSTKEQKKCEDIFKKVQKANNLIGEEGARRSYDVGQTTAAFSPFASATGASYPFGAASGGRPGGSFDRDMYQAFFQRYAQQQRSSAPSSGFSFHGVDISSMFGPGGKPAFWTPRSASNLKSKYVQRVKVPLGYLYNGKAGVDFVLRDNIWKRYRAAFRGGVAKAMLYEAFIVSVSMIRMVKFPWSFVFGAVVFHLSMPKPAKMDYMVDLQAGWKAGTKLTFSDVEPGFDVVFILEEEQHQHYHREDSTLYTTVTITERQRRKGCKVRLEPLDDETPVSVELQPDQIKASGETVKLPGKGWPGRKGKPRGDLVVSFTVVKKKEKKKREKRHKS